MIKIYIYFFISIIIHEMLHILIAKIFKMNLKNLRISIFGASLEIERQVKSKEIKKILMYLAGPFSNLIIAILVKYLNIDEDEKIKIIYTNLCICAFNLLPIMPLDGGNILKQLLKIKLENLKVNKISLIVSKLNLALLTFIYSIAILRIKNISIFLLIIYLWYLNFIEEKKLEILEKTYIIVNKNLSENQNKKGGKILQ